MFRLPCLLLAVCIWADFADRVVATSSMGQSNYTGCDREFLYFEFWSSVPVEEVKKSFENVTVIYSFKVYGAGHYIFVIENDHKDTLKMLTLPTDASMYVTTFPLETISTFLARFDIEIHPTILCNLTDGNLTFVEGTWDAEGLNQDEYRASLVEQIRNIRHDLENRSVVRLMAVGSLPTKLIFFWNKSDCEVVEDILMSTDPLGGPSRLKVRVMKIHNI